MVTEVKIHTSCMKGEGNIVPREIRMMSARISHEVKIHTSSKNEEGDTVPHDDWVMIA